MANKKITDLTNLATPVGADVLAIVDDVAVTPTTKKVTATNLMTLAPVQSVAGRTGTVTLSNTDISGLGTAATQDVGTSASNVVQLDGAAKLPAVDGSQLTSLPSGRSITTPTFTGAPLGYTLTASDNGKVIIVNESNNAYITVPQSLGSGFNCTTAQQGTGTVVLQAGTGASVAGYNLGVATLGQYAVVDLVPVATDSYYVTGDTTTAPFVNTYSAGFDGVDDHLYFGTSATNRDVSLGTTDFAISMWFYPESASQDFLFQDTGGASRVFINGGTLTVKGYGTQVDIASAYSVNNWYHFVLERTSGTQKVYINNVLKSTVASQTGNFDVASFAYRATNFMLEGQMDEISFHSQGLSASDVTAMYNSGAPIDLSGSYNTTNWWRMGDSSSGTSITDQVGSETLTASGANLTNTNVPN